LDLDKLKILKSCTWYLASFPFQNSCNSMILPCRLGHREQKDEWVPRRVDIFTKHNVLPPGAVISAGSVSSACTAGIIC
jgi:hypothetical protein